MLPFSFLYHFLYMDFISVNISKNLALKFYISPPIQAFFIPNFLDFLLFLCTLSFLSPQGKKVLDCLTFTKQFIPVRYER